MKDYLQGLNQAQEAAVKTNAKYARVIAGAGSGKTKVLTSRVAFLINDAGIPESRILAFTFTNKAAKEMKDRVKNTLECETIASSISTFHSFCARFLRTEIAAIGYTRNFVIVDEEDQKEIIKDVKANIDEYKQYKPEQLISYISNCKTYGLSPESEVDASYDDPRKTIPARVFAAYDKYLKDHNYLDFDDLLLKTVEILKKYPKIQEKWQNKFDYILVDEFQDTNDIQFELLVRLASKDAHIFVVGDPDQTIYTWRGANVDIIMDFNKHFKNAEDFILDTNYRSTSSILDAANSVILHNKNRIEKNLISANSKGNKPLCFIGESQVKEADWIANQIRNLVKKDECQLKDIAILYRSNYYSGLIEQSLINQRIKYDIYGSIRFYERKEVKDAMSYLRLIINSEDVLAFNRIINVPRRGIGEKSLTNIIEESKIAGINPYDYLKTKYHISNKKEIDDFIDLIEKYREKIKIDNAPNYRELLQDLLHDSGYYDSLDRIDDEDRFDNLLELGNILFTYQVNDETATLESIIEALSLYSSQDEMEDSDCVKLMTIHTAKGLEFKTVFVAGLSEGVFPTSRALTTISHKEEALEEERRLCYVAFTRAKEMLYLSYNTGFSYTVQNNLIESRFVREAKNYIDFFNKPFYSNQTHSEFYRTSSIEQPKVVNNATFASSSADYRPGNLVEHKVFGEGVVLEVKESSIKVAFKDSKVGVKDISKKFNGITKKV